MTSLIKHAISQPLIPGRNGNEVNPVPIQPRVVTSPNIKLLRKYGNLVTIKATENPFVISFTNVAQS